MSSYQKKSDWGCLTWFLVAFAILALVITVIVLASAPSGGGAGPCQSLSNLDRLGRGNSTGPVKWSSATEGVTHVSSPVRTAKPKTQKPPQGGSGGSHKPPKVDIDLGDCD